MSEIHFFDSEMRLSGGIIVLPVRCTAIKTSQGVVLISPIDFSKDQLEQIDSLGDVTAIVSPSLIHYLFMTKIMERYPKASVWGAPESRTQLPEIPWNFIFENDSWPYLDEIDYTSIQGATRLNEISFFHKPSKTLIVVDMCFNLQHPKGWASPILLRVMGTYKRFAVSRLYNIMVKNREQFVSSLHRLMKWDFEKISMGHGDLVHSNGKRLLIHAFEERGFL